MKKININPDVLALKESATLAINQTAKAIIAQGENVYHWGFGQSPFPISPPIQEELKKRAGHKEYLPTLGLAELRETISKYYAQLYGTNFSPQNIFIGPGSKELIFQLLYLLEGETIVPAPSWVSYGPQVELKGKDPHYLVTERKNNYKFTPKELESVINEIGHSQKVLILNSPSNPTGQYYSEDELEALAVILRKHEVIVISDEIYAQVNFNSETTPSLSQFYPERTIITGGLSKAHSCGGYRLGHMIIPPQMNELIKPLKAMISETFSAVAAPIQYAAIKAWDNTEEVNNDVRICNLVHKACANYFYQRLTAMKIDTPKPQGAFYLFISFAHYREQLAKIEIKNCEDLCGYLLDEFQIALLPGDDFYYPAESLTARLAFVDYNGVQVLAAAKQVKTIDHLFVENHMSQITNGLDRLQNFIDSL